jgi:dTDP-glucose 4,6-dehydratase
MTKVLITGGNGFVGSHIIEHLLKNTDWKIVNIDRLSYSSSGFDRIKDIDAFDNERVVTYTYDLTEPISEGLKKEIGFDFDYILHVAAESHVDNSINHPTSFILNNIKSTINLLEFTRELMSETTTLNKFLYFSTDEVYGSAPKDRDYKEGDRHNAGNPYSASKSASEQIVRAYANTYRIPCVITNTMNILGERQHPEKYLPKVINCVLDGKTLPIHSNKEKTKAGTRFYIHARNVADGILFVLEKTDELLDNYDASKGNFNIVGEKELDNLELAQMIAKCVGKELKYEMVDFHSQRPGHDLRYALDGTKMAKLGWQPPHSIEESIKNIVDWSLKPQNIKWLGR